MRTLLDIKARPRFGQEIIKATWAVLDQAAISLTNFGLNFSLARWADPDVYGTFVVVFSLLLLVYSSIQVPLILDPLIILGGKKDQVSQIIYARRSLLFNVLLSGVSIGILLVSALLLGLVGKEVYVRATFLASVPLFFMNLRFFVRCFYIMKGDFGKSFMNDVVVLLIVFLGVVILMYWNMISDWTVVILMSVAEAAAPLFWLVTKWTRLYRIVLGLFSDFRLQPAFWKWSEVWHNWSYGKWLLLANVASYAYQNAQFLLLPVFVPLASLAGYRASYLLAQPIYLFTTGLEAFAWNRGAKRMRDGGIGGVQDFVIKIGTLVSVLIVIYALLIGVQAELIMKVAYTGKFTKFSGLVWFFTLGALFSFWGKMLGTGFRALEATNVIFLGVFYTGVVGVVAFLLLTKVFGVTGAAASYVISSFVSTLILVGYWLRVVRGGGK